MNTSLRLTVADLAVSRGERLLFERLSFTLTSGEALCVTGPNGIGKTTLLRVIAGFLRPDIGMISLEGLAEDKAHTQAMHLVGYRDGLKAALTVRENLLLAPALFNAQGLSLQDAAAKLELVRLLDLPVAALSSGQRRRAALARLLMAERPLWLLDEPTSALDTASSETVAAMIADHKQRGGMVIAATHLSLGIKARELAFQANGGFTLGEGA